MVPISPYFGDAVQVAVAALTVVLAVVSLSAFRKRPEVRYLLLLLAFVSLCVVSVTTMSLELFAVGAVPTTIPLLEQYIVPSMELLMVVSFLVAIAWSPRVKKRLLPIFLAALVIIGLSVSTAYLSAPGNDGVQSVLPPGCAKPSGGFLIVASSLGFNDSLTHGAPAKSWPILDISRGSNVTITVCNMYSQPVSFQVAHYLERQTEMVLPNHALTVEFVADKTGSFHIYCAVFSAIHLYLQGGEVNVI
jgi:hypothetical protein